MSDPIKASARLVMLRSQERLIVKDIVDKLQLGPGDRLLDIGCGIGNLTIPLSFFVADTLGVDHPECVARLQRRLPEDGLRVLGGDWLDLDLKESFSRILVYDVLHYLSNAEEVRVFIEKALRLLEHGGMMLVGDLPSSDYRARFDDTPAGSTFNGKWNAALQESLKDEMQILQEMTVDTAVHLLRPDKDTIVFSDVTLLNLVLSIRRAGFDAWVVPQDAGLPFATQREDLLVRRP